MNERKFDVWDLAARAIEALALAGWALAVAHGWI
jgi:hypothetical protein